MRAGQGAVYGLRGDDAAVGMRYHDDFLLFGNHEIVELGADVGSVVVHCLGWRSAGGDGGRTGDGRETVACEESGYGGEVSWGVPSAQHEEDCRGYVVVGDDGGHGELVLRRDVCC